MRIVVADTGPICYMVLIGQIDLLPALFEKVILPVAVRNELTSLKAPAPVRQWIGARPTWVEVHGAPPLIQAEDPALKGIDAGEKAAIELAKFLQTNFRIPEALLYRMLKKHRGNKNRL